MQMEHGNKDDNFLGSKYYITLYFVLFVIGCMKVTLVNAGVHVLYANVYLSMLSR